MKFRLWNNEKGISGIDVGVATVVIVLFVSVITTLFYQVYRVSTITKRNAEATLYTTRILENLQNIEYDKITVEENSEVVFMFQEKMGVQRENIEIYPKENQYALTLGGYQMIIKIENYQELKNDTNLEDVIKKITVTVKYSVNKQEESLEMSTLIVRSK